MNINKNKKLDKMKTNVKLNMNLIPMTEDAASTVEAEAGSKGKNCNRK